MNCEMLFLYYAAYQQTVYPLIGDNCVTEKKREELGAWLNIASGVLKGSNLKKRSISRNLNVFWIIFVGGQSQEEYFHLKFNIVSSPKSCDQYPNFGSEG